MKAHRILCFIISVFVLLGAGWLVFPEEGLKVPGTTLRFASLSGAAAELHEEKVDVDNVLSDLEQSFRLLPGSVQDSLLFYKDYLENNRNRIWLPEGDYSYFDETFALLENAKNSGKTYRIMHYGDSQIEMDHITGMFREKMQRLFGGSGPGMIPAQQNVPGVSILQTASGDISRYAIYADSTSLKSAHNRYGVMCFYSKCTGNATITFRQTRHSYAQEGVESFSKVNVLIGNSSANLSVTLKCDGSEAQKKSLESAVEGMTMLSWELPDNIKKGTLTFSGSAEIYAITLDGGAGVAVDNDGMRGCSGTIFTRINSEQLRQSYKMLDTKLIILQFGGNAMPSISGAKSISNYTGKIVKQLDYLKNAAPDAKLLFIGPSDMGKSVNGKIQTWPRLEELNDSLKTTCLRHGVAYWDLFNVMGGTNSMSQWVKHSPPYAASDHIHFSQRGSDIIGEALASSFETYFNFYRLRKTLSGKIIEYYFGGRDAVNSGANPESAEEERR